MCFNQHVLKVYMVQAVRSIAGVITTPHVITSLAPACVQQAGEGHTARKVIFPNVYVFFCQIAPCWQTHHNSFVLFQFVYPVHMGSGVLSDATVLGALPVTM